MRYLKHALNKIISIIIISALLCPVFSLRSYALENWASDVYVASEGACLMDADTGVVLYGKNEENAYYPASITKVMTALLTIENCDNLSEQVTFSYDAVHIEEENSTIIGASEGDKLSVLDCLYSLLFQSANEVANALAEHVGAKHPELKEDGMSDRDVFIKMMNTRAKELGCTGTHFNNPSGLTDSEHYVTAHDMCRILAAAVKNDTFLDIESHTYWTHAPIRRYPDANDPWNTVYAKHAMLKRNSSQYYSGTLAGKTGYTMTAGNTLVTAARRNGMTLVTCVLNAHANHYNDTRRLMDFGFDNFTSLKVIDYDDTNSAIASDFRISGINMVDSKTLGIDPDTRITIPKGGNYIEVRKSLEVSEDADGNSTASLIYSYGDRTVGAAKLKLINIGDGSELYEEAKTDPLLANALGIKTDAELEAESESARAAEESSVNEAQSSEGSEAVGNEASVNGDGDNIQPDSETASIADKAAETAKENTDNAKMKNMGSNGKDTEGDPGDRIDKGELFKKLGFGAVAVIVVLFLLIICNTFRDRRQAERRARRRAARMKRTKDMTGTQQIHMDLELQRRSRKDKKRRKK
ncbi:MAG: serine hydrolase [Eubacteriales bacterium]|nr:serine hydrolase [Eubacteriales bacterium]